MYPAPSIIAFTILAGLGYGLAFVLGFNLLAPTVWSTRIAHVAALSLISAGLLASTLHLGNPQRAWRALSQWRSSWLSREGVLAIATFAPLLVSGWASIVDGRYIAMAGLAGSAGCAATVFCTSMIYASLRSIDAWRTGWTTVCFLLFSLAGGLTAATLIAAIAGTDHGLLAVGAIIANCAAWLAKMRWRIRMNTMKPRSTAASATGLGHLGAVRQFEPPHMTPNYLTHEMGFKIARKHADKLFGLALMFGGVVPVLALFFATVSAGNWTVAVCAIALVGHILGVGVERWLFFAEARHSVQSFYGS